MTEEVDRMCVDDLVSGVPGVEIVGHVLPEGQPVTPDGVGQVMWTRQSLCAGVYVCMSEMCFH